MSWMDVLDKDYIDNTNEAMIFIFDIQHEQFGNELVLNDGRISEVHTPFKRIKER